MSRVVVAAFLALVGASGQQYRVSTIAGGVPLPSPQTALHASIGDIGGKAIGSAGYFFISSVDLGCVFKIDPNGSVTRVAGTCQLGYSGDGGPAVRAQLNQPSGLALDQNGPLYITDRGNQVIRKASKEGTITTVAGGHATTEQLTMPTAVTADSSGNLYIADSSNSRVLRIATNGTVWRQAAAQTVGTFDTPAGTCAAVPVDRLRSNPGSSGSRSGAAVQPGTYGAVGYQARHGQSRSARIRTFGFRFVRRSLSVAGPD